MKLDMIGIVVTDIVRSLPFYRLLGLEIADCPEGESYHETTLPSGIRISWNAEAMMRQIEPGWEVPIGQRVSLAFLCDSPEEVDARYKKITDAGYTGHKAPYDAFWGQRYAQVSDPDGNTADLFAPLPG